MANIKSAKKRIKITAKKTLRNKMIKSRTKTEIKKVLTAIAAGSKDEAMVAYTNAVSAIDRATAKGIFHKNNASRKKSRLAKRINRIGA